MLFIIFMSILFIVPCSGYYLIWTKVDWQQYNVPSTQWHLLVVFLIYLMVCSSVFIIYGYAYPSLHGIYTWCLFLIFGVTGPGFLSYYLHHAKEQRFGKQKVTPQKTNLRVLMIGMMLVLNLGPITIYSLGTSICYFSSFEEINSIFHAVEMYKLENGVLPNSFSLLYGEHLAQDTKPKCVSDFGTTNDEGVYVPCYVSHPNDVPEFIQTIGNTEILVLYWFFGPYDYFCGGGLEQ